MDRYEQARELAKMFGFIRLFDEVSKVNPSNDLPYHNWFHTCCMICNCMEGALHYNLSYSECHLLGVAALFHDFDHTGGREHDSINIHRALASLNIYVEGSNLELKHIRACISVTQFPFDIEPVTIEQKIIRDADLMQILEPEWYEHVILGLQAEMSIKNGPISTQDMLAGQVNFLFDHVPSKLFTEWAKQKFESDVYRCRLEEISDLLREITQ